MTHVFTVRRLAFVLATLGLARVSPAGAQSNAERQQAPALGIGGTWVGGDWGTVVIGADGGGTYTATYESAYGRLQIRPAGERRYVGTWGESVRRFGTLALEL